jgi:hypothetical protein
MDNDARQTDREIYASIWSQTNFQKGAPGGKFGADGRLVHMVGFPS